MADDGLIAQIDEGLRQLYEWMKKENSNLDAEYDNNFQELCDENGYDDDTVEEELGASPEDTQLDEDFLADLCPWLPENDPDRANTIRKYMNKLAKDKDAFKNGFKSASGPKVEEQHFKIKDHEMERAVTKRESKAPKVIDGGFKIDSTLKYMLAVGDKMKVNYLQFLVDMYLREFVYYHYANRDKKNVPKFNVDTWGRQNDHVTKKLKNITCNANGQTADDVAKAAVRSYLHRVAPKLLLKPATRIQGNLKELTSFISQTIQFVAKKAGEYPTVCPFQYDAVFVFPTAVNEEQEDDDDDDEEEDDDDEDDGDSKDNNDSKIPKDIGKVLNDCKLINQTALWNQVMLGGDQRPLDVELQKL